jgi:hypothetical protein
MGQAEQQKFVTKSLATVGSLYEAMKALDAKNKKALQALAAGNKIKLSDVDMEELIAAYHKSKDAKLKVQDLFTTRVC